MRLFVVRCTAFCVCFLSFLWFSSPLAAQGSFTLTVTPSALSIPQGGQETATVTTTISGGFNSSIALSASGTPPGVVASFNPLIIGAPGAGVSTMTVSVIRLTLPGNYTITVNGVGGGIKQTATLTLTVTAQGKPGFTLSASPARLSIVQGTQGNSTLTTTVEDGFNSSITLSASGMPAGITVSFAPTTIPAPGAGHSTMTITVGNTTPSGTYPITVTANGGGLWQETAVTVMVASFTISASPASLSISQGNQGTSQVTTTVSGGFNYAITLSASGMPSGTTVSFNPTTIPAPGSGSSIMTIIVGSNTPVGTYPITVTGSGGGLLQMVTITLTVTSSGGEAFTLAVTPTSLSLPQNTRGYAAVTTRINGFNNSISLAASGIPQGVTLVFTPPTIPAPGVGNATMNFVVFVTAKAGVYPVTITATGGGIKQTVTLTLTITVAGQPNYMLTAGPASLSIAQGGQISSSINSTISGTFNSAISLSASGLPAGATASFAPATLAAPGSGNSVMTLELTKSVSPGSYPVTVTGNGGGIQQTASLTLNVTPLSAMILPNSDFMQPYSYTLQSSFGKPPYTYQLSGGTLPPGLSMSQQGNISGDATATGQFPFSVLVTDSSQPPKQQTSDYSLNAIIGLDTYGGLTAAPVPGCTSTGYFQLSTVRGRWLLADPECNAFYQRSVYDTDRLFILQQTMQQRYDNNTHLWADHSLQRMTGWGFNATDIYSSLYTLPVPAGGEPPADIQVPFALYYPALRDVLIYPQDLGLPEAVKDICHGFDSNGYQYYCTDLVDVFDPKWTQGNQAEVQNQVQLYTGGFNTDPWITAISLGDSDFVFALKGNGANPYNVGAYPHAGMMVATVDFDYSSQGFVDPQLHSKYQWVNYLQNKYGTIGALNQSWNTGGFYTTFGDAGGFGTGTGVLDEDGRHTAWFGSDLANRYFTLVGVNSNLVADMDAFLYQFTVQVYGVQASAIKAYDQNHVLECGNFGGIGEGGMRPPVMQGLHDSGCGVVVGNWNSTWPAVALSGNQAQYDAMGLPEILWYGISSQEDSDTSEYPTRGASFADYPSQFARGQQYANDQQTIFNAQGTNGDYYIMGIAFWGLTDNSSEGTNWGFITFMDNAYDGRCAVVGQGTDQYGYPCGGEAANYGDFLDTVTQSNSSILQQFIKSLNQ